MTGTIIKILLFVLIIAYPFLVFFSVDHLSLNQLGITVLSIAAIKMMFDIKQMKHFPAPMILAATMAVVSVYGILMNSADAFRYYPVIVNLIMFSFFAISLRQKQTIIEKLARLQDPNLPPEGVIYTRKVTKAWCLFFLINGAIALWTAIAADLKLWTLYNGLIAYILIGVMFMAEWLIRQRVIQHQIKSKKS